MRANRRIVAVTGSMSAVLAAGSPVILDRVGELGAPVPHTIDHSVSPEAIAAPLITKCVMPGTGAYNDKNGEGSPTAMTRKRVALSGIMIRSSEYGVGMKVKKGPGSFKNRFVFADIDSDKSSYVWMSNCSQEPRTSKYASAPNSDDGPVGKPKPDTAKKNPNGEIVVTDSDENGIIVGWGGRAIWRPQCNTDVGDGPVKVGGYLVFGHNTPLVSYRANVRGFGYTKSLLGPGVDPMVEQTHDTSTLPRKAIQLADTDVYQTEGSVMNVSFKVTNSFGAVVSWVMKAPVTEICERNDGGEGTTNSGNETPKDFVDEDEDGLDDRTGLPKEDK